MVLLEGIELSTSPLPRETMNARNPRELADFLGFSVVCQSAPNRDRSGNAAILR
jgi:hypothetical protein